MNRQPLMKPAPAPDNPTVPAPATARIQPRGGQGHGAACRPLAAAGAPPRWMTPDGT
jgi:hypothetical protein